MKEFLDLIGKPAVISLGGLEIYVRIQDVKTSYGHTRYLVSPIGGTGNIWIEKIQLKKVIKKGKKL